MVTVGVIVFGLGLFGLELRLEVRLHVSVNVNSKNLFIYVLNSQLHKMIHIVPDK